MVLTMLLTLLALGLKDLGLGLVLENLVLGKEDVV